MAGLIRSNLVVASGTAVSRITGLVRIVIFGMVIGQGGADTMVKALTGYLKELGGEVHINAPVAEVVHSAGSANGVRLADGQTITARRAR